LLAVEDGSPRRIPIVRPRDVLALVLALSLTAPQVVLAQQPAARPAPRGLRILVLQGQDAVNSLPSSSAASPAVQVFDYLGEPVEGAEVTFDVPTGGPGGLFDNQKPTFTTRTDARGQAVSNFIPNTLPGRFTIRVVARFGGESAEASIAQTNSSKSQSVEYKPAHRPWYKDWKWWAIIGAGAGAGGYWIYSSSTSNPTIGLSPGAITIGGPR
jgi:hypothetical protein